MCIRDRHWNTKFKADIFYAKGEILSILKQLGVKDVIFKVNGKISSHVSINIFSGKQTIGNLCSIGENLKEKYKIKSNVVYSEISIDKILKNLKTLFKRQGYVINWNDLQKQSLDQTINTLSMASPFSLEEKQILLEATNLNKRREKLEEILHTYILDKFSNTTIQ